VSAPYSSLCPVSAPYSSLCPVSAPYSSLCPVSAPYSSVHQLHYHPNHDQIVFYNSIIISQYKNIFNDIYYFNKPMDRRVCDTVRAVCSVILRVRCHNMRGVRCDVMRGVRCGITCAMS
jgi:hypothetical protein